VKIYKLILLWYSVKAIDFLVTFLNYYFMILIKLDASNAVTSQQYLHLTLLYTD